MSQSLDSNCPGVASDGSVFSVDASTEAAVAGNAGRQVVAGGALLLDLSLLTGWIVASDWLLFRVGTFLTWGLFFLLAVLLLWSVKSLRPERLFVESANTNSRRVLRRRFFFTASIAILILLLSLKLLWCGSWLQIVCGLALVLTFAMVLAGHPPFLPEVLGFAIAVISGAAQRMVKFRFGTLNEATGVVKPVLGLAVMLPVIAVLAFSTLFVLANPNLATSLALYLRTAWQATSNLLFSISPFEFVFWILSGWALLGLLYPASCRLWNEARMRQPTIEGKFPDALYAAYRNSLLSLIVLFSIYLVFEFSTLWFRTFPKNFYYAGYAHQGAFWLTTALALATVVLSFIFRDKTVGDPRMKSLKRWAMLWSLTNLLLSVAVYNRLLIYIDFNGLTRMRVIGLLGITCVVMGFALVVTKIARDRSFVWLLHRQLWVPCLAVLAFALLPVDWLVNSYNARHVLAGDMAPVVQIVAHRSSAEGMLPLLSLIDVDDRPVREGVRALLSLWVDELNVAEPLHVAEQATTDGAAATDGAAVEGIAVESQELYNREVGLGHSSPWLELGRGFSRAASLESTTRPVPHWTTYQLAESQLARRLRQRTDVWTEYSANRQKRDAAIATFFEYAYQWY